MLKIAVFTLPLCNNYGGILQAYAMMELLKELGHEPTLIYLRLLDESPKHRALQRLKVAIKGFLSFFKKEYQGINYKPNITNELSKDFIKRYINPKTDEIYNSNELQDLFEKEKFDAVILGSDQVFRPPFFAQFCDDFTLKFTDILKISYAPSFGAKEFLGDKNKISIYKNELAKFKAHSVREKNAISICQELFEIEALHVLDPTMCVCKETLINLTKGIKSGAEGKILCYILDMNDKKAAYIKALESKFGLASFVINGEAASKDISINEWICAFSSAKMVLTDSFHGAVFSIIFKKDFFVFTNKMRGLERFNSLFGMFGLEDREVNNFLFEKTGFINLDSINWQKVDEILIKEQEKSREFLIANLKK